MKKGLITLMSLFVLVIAGCSSPSDSGSGSGSETEAEAGLDLATIATGGTGGVYYPIGGGIAQILEEELGITATAQVTGASVENMQLLSKGDVQIAFTQNDIADYAVNGIEVFDEKLEGISGISTLYPEIIQLVVAADSDIQSVEDLKGKKVSVGAPGSGNEANSVQILEAAGLTYDDIEEELKSYADSADSFKDGLIDAMFVTSGVPNASVSDIAVTKGVRVISIDDEVIAALKEKYPFFIDEVVPAGSYDGQDEDAKTVAVLAALTVNSDLSEDDVYDITKAIYDNLDTLGSKHEKAKEITLEKALDGLTIPLHPGAQKYFDEEGISQ
ncbi:TAXI family TRAP transporter solute-binding subunit [Jeotgalibacillus soli]|uniref:C4-dicarboxylate ABC transporter substrate-binding protein n=1 Tax=Jeotgalibacillus soli TaxID=889306 RepID=A0A0C2RGU6_9BACL|nr:TAXI family TRAP transporter solute-binding subunit [Jeotgalibacillus soli]KIL49395.1 C4-dicarboxylate ABC transporter substrate-binding protein [Jeotgalibacillus soli]